MKPTDVWSNYWRSEIAGKRLARVASRRGGSSIPNTRTLPAPPRNTAAKNSLDQYIKFGPLHTTNIAERIA
jgi:hypothetical protein